PDLLVANVCASGSNCSNGSVGVLLNINGGGTFQGAITYNAGDQNAYSVAVADLNGDNKPDLIVANECASGSNCSNGSLDVLLGNGDGTFQGAVSYPSGGYHAVSVAVADVNGDGHPDLLVANMCAGSSNCANGTISVLLGNGDGTFQVAVPYNSGGEYAYSIAVADVNGDGHPDLLVANECQTYASCGNGGGVSVLLGNGDGTFQVPVSYNSGGYEAYSIAVADVNADGHLDLLVANSCASFSDCENGGGVSVLLGNGDGTFQAAVSYSSGGYQAVAVVVANVTNKVSNPPALLVANQCASSTNCSNGSLGVLLGNGDGTFQPAIITSTPEFSMGQIAVADFNGDGFLDAAIGSGTVLLLGNGDGTFQTPLSLGASGNDIAVGDFNNDGRPDLAVGGVTILLNILPAVTSSVNPVGVGQSVTFTATISSGRGNSPKGTVTFFDSGSEIGTGSIASGHAQFTTSSLGTGSHSITAAYAGDGRYQPSPSAPLNEVVTSKLVATRTKVTTSGSPSRIHQPVTFTATVSSAHGSIPNGEIVTFYDATASIGTGTTAGGVATLTTSSLSAKTHTIKATYAGDHTFKTSSGTVKQVVERYPSTTTLTSNPNPSTSGESVTLTATVSSGAPGGATGTVTFKNGSTTLGKATLSSGTATISTTKLPVGTLTITADYSGDAESTESSGSVKQVVNN
ncbi:MAG: Ig-like domain repeat protein, partial [Terriglobales bacterium]